MKSLSVHTLPSLPGVQKFLSVEECRVLFDKIVSMTNGGGTTIAAVTSRWRGGVIWSRNRVDVAGDTSTAAIVITRSIRGAQGTATTSDLSQDGLALAIRDAELTARVEPESPPQPTGQFVDEPILHPNIWSEGTYRLTLSGRLSIARDMIDSATKAGLQSFGEFSTMAYGKAVFSTTGLSRYYPVTAVECSMTVRDGSTASGWAGCNHFDLARLSPKAIAMQAVQKCQMSASPRAIEPGRYTVILEPQATADLLEPLMQAAPDGVRGNLSRIENEVGLGPFAGRESGRSKIGERVMDPRLFIRSDPQDSDGPFVPFLEYDGVPFRPVDWIERGMLRDLAYDRQYALAKLNRDQALPNPQSFRFASMADVSTTNLAEMIARTKRGILVTRFSNIEVVDIMSLLCTGYTRDGLWLVEDGKISFAIKNFRFTESPLFAFNKVVDIGAPVRVFKPGFSYLAPALRIEDFSFSGLADAV